MVHNENKILSIAPPPKGHIKDSDREALLRVQFGNEYAKAYSALEVNSVVFNITEEALQRYPDSKKNMIWVSQIILGLADMLGFARMQPKSDFVTEILTTEKEWGLVLLQPKLYRMFRSFQSDNREYARIRLPEVLIHVIANGDMRERIVTNMEELVARCMTPDHKKYESEMKVMFFIAANVIHNFLRLEKIDEDSLNNIPATA